MSFNMLVIIFSRSLTIHISKFSIPIYKVYQMITFSKSDLLSKFTQKLQSLQKPQSSTITKDNISTKLPGVSPNLHHAVSTLNSKIEKINFPLKKISPPPVNLIDPKKQSKATTLVFNLNPAKQVQERKQHDTNLLRESTQDKINKLKRQIIANSQKQTLKKFDKKPELKNTAIQESKNIPVVPAIKAISSEIPKPKASPFSFEKIPPKPVQITKDKKQAMINKKIDKQKQDAQSAGHINGLSRFFSANNFTVIQKPGGKDQMPLKTPIPNQSKQPPVQTNQNARCDQPSTKIINQPKIISKQFPEQPFIWQTPQTLNPPQNTPQPIDQARKPLPTPYLYLINNLLSLSFSKKIPPQLILLYINQLHLKHNLPYASIIITFGIQYMVARFYQIHDMELHAQFQMNGKYIIYYLDLVLPDFIALTKITDWNTICQIGRGATLRFGKEANRMHSTDWMYFAICRKKQFIKDAGIDLAKIFQGRLMRQKQIPSSANRHPVVQYDDKYLQELKNKYRYSTLAQYLVDRKKLNFVLEEPNQEVLAERVQKEGVSKARLLQYKKMREIMNPVLATEQDIKKNQFQQQKQFQQISFQILKLKSRLPPNAIIHRTYKQVVIDEFVCVDIKSDDSECDSDSSSDDRPRAQLDDEGKPIVYSHVAKKSTSNIIPNVRYMYGDEKSEEMSMISEKSQEKNPNNKKVVSTCRKTTSQTISKTQIIKNRIKQKSKLNIQQMLKKMDELINEYHQSKPEFTMEQFLQFLSKILTDVIKAPAAMHEKLTTMWMSKYC